MEGSTETYALLLYADIGWDESIITKDVTIGFNTGESLLLKINVRESCIIKSSNVLPWKIMTNKICSKIMITIFRKCVTILRNRILIYLKYFFTLKTSVTMES